MKLATLCYVRRGGKTLMMHRIKKQDDMHAGKWNGLGGKLDPGETPEECAVREVHEESGLRISRPALKGVLTFPAFSKGEDWYAFVFVATDFTGTLIESSEGVLDWIDDDQLLELNLWEGDRIFLRWLDQDDFFSAKFIYHEGRLTNHEVVFYTRSQHQSPEKPILVERTDGQHPLAAGYDPAEDDYCWLCRGPTTKRHCKIVCQTCGFTRDCSDP